MRHIIFLFLALVVFVSACINLGDTQKAGLSFIEKNTEDILIRAELSQPELKSGMNTSLRFTVSGKQNHDLENFNLNVYDLCDFQCSKEPLWSESLIRANRTKDFTLSCKAPATESETSCAIKFRATYEGRLSQTHDVFVISESEFATGRTKVSPASTETKSPLKISLSWSDTQPFVEKDKISMFLDYSYSGDGIIEKLRPGDVSFSFPKSLSISEGNCRDFYLSEAGENYTLSKDLLFLSGKAKQSTCVFETKASQPIESGNILLSAKFLYQLEGSITAKVLPRKNI